MKSAFFQVKPRLKRLCKDGCAGADEGYRRSAALVVVLFLVALIFAVALLYMRLLILDQEIVAPLTSHRQAVVVTGECSQLIIAALREEARVHARDPETTPWHLKDTAPAMPHRSLPLSLQSNKRSALLKVSYADLPFYADDTLVLRPFEASNDRLSDADGSGWLISSAQLNATALLPPDAPLSPDAVHWIYFTDAGPLRGNPDISRQREITGRMAFIVYHTDGLLDINHAGNGLAANPSMSLDDRMDFGQLMAGKGNLRFAHMQSLIVTGPSLDNQTEPAAEVIWGPQLKMISLFRDPRSPRISGTSGSQIDPPATDLESYSRYLQTFARTMPGESIVAGQQAFLGRADFLRMTKTEALKIDSEQTHFFTTFSRILTSVPPSDNLPADPVANSSVWTKFSLRHLNLLAFDFPDPSRPDPQREAAIARFFGLARNSSSQPWEYVGSGGNSTLARSIASFEDVSTETANRPMNFFETLKTAIDPGSLGHHLDLPKAATGTENFHRNRDIHLLRIGANIIDQWDADSFPTRITLNTDEGPVGISGIENLPYIEKLHLDALDPRWDDPNEIPVEERLLLLYMIPELWNPHAPPVNRDAGSNETIFPGSAPWLDSANRNAGPANIRLRSRGSFKVEVLPVDTYQFTLRDHSYTSEILSDHGSVTIASKDFHRFSPLPRAVREAQASGMFHNGELVLHGKALPYFANEDGSLPGLEVFAARLGPDSSAQELAECGTDASPLPIDGSGQPFYTGVGAPEEVYQETQVENQPYPGMRHEGYTQNHYWIWDELADDRRLLNLQLGHDPMFRFDVVLDYQDHLGRWQTYQVFGADGDLLTGEAGLTFEGTFFDGMALEGEDRFILANYLDTNGSLTLYRADPRTGRLGIAADSELLTNLGEFPLRGASGNAGRGPKNSLLVTRTTEPPDNLNAIITRYAGFYLIIQYFPGLFSENIDFREEHPETSDWETFYSDPDGLVRPGDAFLLRRWIDLLHELNPGSGGTNDEWELDRRRFSIYSNQAARPRLLNRPFQSVAELGYVFRDLPFRSLDLTSDESADRQLLDWFTLEESAMAENGQWRPLVRAGVINPEAAIRNGTSEVLGTILTGASIAPPTYFHKYVESPLENNSKENIEDLRAPGEPNAPALLPPVLLSSRDAENIIGELSDLTAPKDLTILQRADLIPALNRAADRLLNGQAVDLEKPMARNISTAGEFADFSGGMSTPFSVIKSEREATIRALADVSNPRTWNFLIDIFLQTGKFTPGSPAEAGEFMVRSQRREWHSVAIDRFTGAVIDHQKEIMLAP